MHERSPLREPMVWLMAGLPLASVVAGIALVVTAIRSGGADAVADDVQRTGQVQTAELGPDARAHALQLSAVLRRGRHAIEVLPVAGNFVRSEPLFLSLRHPGNASRDRHLVLQPTELGWRAAIDADATHDWILQIAPTDGTWRLHGRLPRQQQAAYLHPALASD